MQEKEVELDVHSLSQCVLKAYSTYSVNLSYRILFLLCALNSSVNMCE